MKKKQDIYISIVSPVYGCAKSLPELYERCKKAISPITDNFEIILVNDGSPDKAWNTITQLAETDNRVVGINLSRNFGQHYAITAGLDYAAGDWVVVLDCDLQDVPEEIPKLYAKAQDGFDLVLGRREFRKDSFLKRFGSTAFYKLFSYLTDTYQDHTIANFGIYSQKVIAAILAMNDSIKYFPTMSQWVGFSKTEIKVTHSSRAEGKSAYNLRSLLNLAFDNIIAFSNKPLKLFVKFGFLIVLFSIIIAIYYLAKYLMGDIVILGYSSLIISIWFLSGINIMILGVVGIYVGKTFERVKDRPSYIIKNIIQND